MTTDIIDSDIEDKFADKYGEITSQIANFLADGIEQLELALSAIRKLSDIMGLPNCAQEINHAEAQKDAKQFARLLLRDVRESSNFELLLEESQRLSWEDESTPLGSLISELLMKRIGKYCLH